MKKDDERTKGRFCQTCGERLHISEFRYQKRREDGKHMICIDCEPEFFAGGLVGLEPGKGAKYPPPGAKKAGHLSPFQKGAVDDTEKPPRAGRAPSIVKQAPRVIDRLTVSANLDMVVEHFDLLVDSLVQIANQIHSDTEYTQTRRELKLEAKAIFGELSEIRSRMSKAAKVNK